MAKQKLLRQPKLAHGGEDVGAVRADIKVRLLDEQSHNPIFVNQDRLAYGYVARRLDGAIEQAQVALRVGNKGKVKAEAGGEGELALLPCGGVNGNGQNTGVVSEKVKSLITERSKVIRSPASEALGEERQ